MVILKVLIFVISFPIENFCIAGLPYGTYVILPRPDKSHKILGLNYTSFILFVLITFKFNLVHRAFIAFWYEEDAKNCLTFKDQRNLFKTEFSVTKLFNVSVHQTVCQNKEMSLLRLLLNGNSVRSV